MLFPWNHNLHALKIDFVPLQNDSSGSLLCPDITSDKRLVFFQYSPMTDSSLQLCDCMNTTLPEKNRRVLEPLYNRNGVIFHGR